MNSSELLQLAKGWSNFISDRIIIWRLLYSLIIKSDFPSVIAPDLHKLTQHLHKNKHKKRGYCLMAITSIILILNKHFWHIINNSFYFLSNRFSVAVQKGSSNTHHIICINFNIHFFILFYKS